MTEYTGNYTQFWKYAQEWEYVIEINLSVWRIRYEDKLAERKENAKST